MTARSDARRARRETVVLALLAYRPGGWTARELREVVRWWDIYVVLARLEMSGQVRSRFVDGQYPRRCLYDVADPS